MSTAVLDREAVERIAEQVTAEEDNHIYCCIDVRPVCGVLLPPIDVWALGFNGPVDCVSCAAIEAGLTLWTCPRCGCSINVCCDLCCKHEDREYCNPREPNSK